MILQKIKSGKLSLFVLLAIFITTGFFIFNSRSFVSAATNCELNAVKVGATSISGVCSITSQYEGVASGNLTMSAGGQLTINAGATLVLSPGQTINFAVSPGQIVANGSPSIVKGSLCATDVDGDGYAKKVTAYSAQTDPIWDTYAAGAAACPSLHTARQNLVGAGSPWQLDCVDDNISVQKVHCVPSAPSYSGWSNVASCGSYVAGQQYQSRTWSKTVSTAADCGGDACSLSGTEYQYITCGVCTPGATRYNYCGVGQCYASTLVTCTSAGEWPTTCNPGTPVAETCNGLDDNCDGTNDNGLTQPSQACTVGCGTCQRTGTQYQTCQGVAGWSTWGACSVTAGTPPTCAALGYNCGSPSDTCCGTLSCGTCGGGTPYCNNYVCGVCSNGSTEACDGNADGYNCGTRTCSSGSWGSCTGDPGVAWYYRDYDVDAYGDPNVATLSCAGQTSISYGGYTYRNNSYDCNDYNAGIGYSASTAHAGSCGSGACLAYYTNDTCSYGTWTSGTCTPGTAETDAAFCARYGANCGSLTGTDNCNVSRTVASCGTCTSPQVCSGNTCVTSCTPESDATFCSRYGYTCGSLSGTDNCGVSRYVASCGSCTTGYTCNGSTCYYTGGGGCTPHVCCCDAYNTYWSFTCGEIPPGEARAPLRFNYDIVRIAAISKDGVHFAVRIDCSGLCDNCGVENCQFCFGLLGVCQSTGSCSGDM